jgi:RNA polymerase sigma-70 factor (ECF subfamily)
VSGTTGAQRVQVNSEFEAIFLEHYDAVLRVLVRLVGAGQAEELANEVFFRLSRQPERWLITNNVGGWLYRTATRAGIDALRAAARRTRYEQTAASEGTLSDGREAGPLRDILRDEHRKRVQFVLSGMKPAQAQLLLMRAGGSSYKEIAEITGVSVGGVGTTLNRAEAEFRKRYLKLTGEKESL